MGLFGFVRTLLHGRGRTPEDLMAWLDMGEGRYREFRPAYRRFTIPKRSGGSRTIDAPDEPTARVQRLILNKLLRRLPVHAAATGFRRGVSIVDNAAPHVDKDVVIRLDLRDFFSSITLKQVIGMFRRVGWNRPAARWIAAACTHEGRLPQGAPTSPALSNLVCFRLDSRLAGLAQSFGADYTRYADDITFSLREDRLLRSKQGQLRADAFTGQLPRDRRPPELSSAVHGLVVAARRIVEREGFRARGRKTRILRRHQRQTVTGLVVNEKVNLPRKTRRRLRAIRHRRETTGSSTLTQDQLAGWRGFEVMVERGREAD